MSERKYVGKGKKVGQYDMINIGLKYSDLQPNEKGFVNLTVGAMKNVDDKGNTHTVWINDYKPAPKQKSERDSSQMQVEDMPF